MTEYEKRRLRWARCTGCAALGILALLVALGLLLWRAGAELRAYERRVDTIVTRMEDVSAQLAALEVEDMVRTLNGVSAELKDVDVHGMAVALDSLSAQLEAIDWEELAGNVNEMAVSTQERLAEAGEALALAESALQQLDIEALNRAITDLQTVVEPLAEMVSRFR